MAILIRRLRRFWPNSEIIVVANGCTDKTEVRARRAGARVIHFDMPLGPDVGRAIGAFESHGNVVLFLDADFVVQPEQLEPFVQAVQSGVDVALNRYPRPGSEAYRHPVSIAKRALNCFLDRPELGAASLTAVPHALSRKAINSIGYANLAVPPVAQSLAITRELRVESVKNVPVGRSNRDRPAAYRTAMTRLILGDCLEAVNVIHQHRGSRGGFSDLGRKRGSIQPLANSGLIRSLFRPSLAAVVPVRDEQLQVGKSLELLRESGIHHIFVVANGCQDSSVQIAEHAGATVRDFVEPLGHDVGRAIGSALFPADNYLFIDGDLAIDSKEMNEFLQATMEWDVALNDIDALLPESGREDCVTAVKRFLNLVLDRADLGAASLTAVPNFIRHHVIADIGVDSLAVPPLAHAKAILADYRVGKSATVDVIKTNRRRPELHDEEAGKPIEKLILGDHLEALQHVIEAKGLRGLFPDTWRRRRRIELYIRNRRFTQFRRRGRR